MRPADDFIAAARCPAGLGPQKSGPWEIRVDPVLRIADRLRVGFSSLTVLMRNDSMVTMHLGHGEVVMEDSREELLRHLAIWRAGSGRILVTGLGLGCVVRGLLSKREVDHIDVVELDPRILAMVGPEFAGDPRVTLHHADARDFDPAGRRWDYAWHDVWTEGNVDLQNLHGELMTRFSPLVSQQGAWAFPRCIARAWPTPLLGAPRRRAA